MFQNINGIEVFYEIIGEGKPIVMIHGFMPDHRLMKGCMEPIFKKRAGYKRIYFDLPGMGKTKAARDKIKTGDDVLDLILKFIDFVIPNQQFLIAGESYGGYLARAVIQKRFKNVDGMVLICPAIHRDRTKLVIPAHQVFKKDSKLISKLPPKDKVTFESICVLLDERNWLRFKEEVITGLDAADRTFLNDFNDRATVSFDPDKTLPKSFDKPSLILEGRQDSMIGYKAVWDILDYYPRATLAILDVAGHNLQIEQDVLLSSLINEWLNRVENKL